MTTAVRQVNPNRFEFVQAIAAKFDQVKFPDTESTSIVAPFGELGQTFNERELRHLAVQNLPAETHAEIASFAPNFSRWVLITGMTDPAVQRVHQRKTLDYSAEHLLKRLEISRNFQSPRVQLRKATQTGI